MWELSPTYREPLNHEVRALSDGQPLKHSYIPYTSFPLKFVGSMNGAEPQLYMLL